MFFDGRISSSFFEHTTIQYMANGHGLLTYRGSWGMCSIASWIIEGFANFIFLRFYGGVFTDFFKGAQA
jgi:hypothetical protein